MRCCNIQLLTVSLFNSKMTLFTSPCSCFLHRDTILKQCWVKNLDLWAVMLQSTYHSSMGSQTSLIWSRFRSTEGNLAALFGTYSTNAPRINSRQWLKSTKQFQLQLVCTFCKRDSCKINVNRLWRSNDQGVYFLVHWISYIKVTML